MSAGEMKHDETQLEVSEVAAEAGETTPEPTPPRRLPQRLVPVVAGVIVVILLCICLGLLGGGYYVYNQGILAGIGIGTKPSVRVVQNYMQDAVKAIQGIRQAYEPLLQYVDPEERDRERLDLPTAIEIEGLEYELIEESATRAVVAVKGEYFITWGSGEEATTTRESLDETITVIKGEDGKWYLAELPYWWPPGF